MKLKKDFILKKDSGQNVILYTGKDPSAFNSTITLNETAAFLWSLLCSGACTKEQLLTSLLKKYDISTVLALNDIDIFVKTLQQNGILEE